jgi:hypothetical protein
MIPYGEQWLEAALVKLPTSSGTKSMIFRPIDIEFWRIPLNDMSQESRIIRRARNINQGHNVHAICAFHLGATIYSVSYLNGKIKLKNGGWLSYPRAGRTARRRIQGLTITNNSALTVRRHLIDFSMGIQVKRDQNHVVCIFLCPKSSPEAYLRGGTGTSTQPTTT